MPQPLFFNEIKYIPSIEVAMHRGLWSFVLLFFLLLCLNEFKSLTEIFTSIKNIIFLSITATLIAINWTGFIYSVSIDLVQDASLGYFLTPMISICFGYIFLKEKLNFNKLISVLLMFIACLILILNSKNFPFVSIIIGSTWAIYGLLRKQIKVSPATGLLYESGLISIFALPYLIYLNYIDKSYFNINFDFSSIMLILTGAVTIFPLFFFNLGLKYITLGLTGVLFYIAPSFHFITALYLLNETLPVYKIIAFILIWIGVGLFIYDALKKNKTI